MRNDDRIRLHHMLDAATDALSFAEEATREDLDTDRKLVMAVVKCVEIVGEAADRTGEKIENSADWDATYRYYYDGRGPRRPSRHGLGDGKIIETGEAARNR